MIEATRMMPDTKHVISIVKRWQAEARRSGDIERARTLLAIESDLERFPSCVTPNGRTDSHGAFIQNLDGMIICSFCKEPV